MEGGMVERREVVKERGEEERTGAGGESGKKREVRGKGREG